MDDVDEMMPDDWLQCEGILHAARGGNQRQRIDEYCSACGVYGHNIAKDGSCDITAMIYRVLKWIKESNHTERKNLLKHHAAYQKLRRENIKKREKQPKQGRVKKAIQENPFADIFHDMFDSDSSSDSEDETSEEQEN